MSEQQKTKVAVIGSGNIGTDLMIKILRISKTLEIAAMVGIDPNSDGLARAGRFKVWTTHEGVDGLIAKDDFDEIKIVLDATSAGAHRANAAKLAPYGKKLVDLTPAAIGPYVVPAINLETHEMADNVNMVTCGGQATIPIVYAVSRVTDVPYAEIVASVASKSAGPGTRANIDEFTETTSRAIEEVGGAERGKAIIVLNPAEPPLLMRDTVICEVGEGADEDAIIDSIGEMAAEVASYVPGYRLKAPPQFDRNRVIVLLEVEGAGDFLEPFSGNLDIMTSAAARVGESLAERVVGVPS